MDNNGIPVKLDVAMMLYEFANAEISGWDDAEYIRSNAEDMAAMVSQLLAELDATELPEVRQIMDKWGVVL
jgi:hypothetical protein